MKKNGNENYSNAAVAIATIRFTCAPGSVETFKVNVGCITCTAQIGGNELAVCVPWQL